ncbi:hypothetical protein NDU88_006014 [Pleurodeles waltl]|uniref:Uncharacterized protein n=1 Tax=Pleurodeles waltl TaxID=8319 RepID=A0AAV7VLL0_PLEWA|nr:hypothetical protein NDU88_006014 [Pleurodeles waltl]
MLAGLCFKVSLAGNTRCDSAWTVNWSLRSAIKFFVRGTEYLSWRFAKLITALSGPLKVNMVPKAIQNIDDEGEGPGQHLRGKTVVVQPLLVGGPQQDRLNRVAKTPVRLPRLARMLPSRWARIATKLLQGAVRKVVKSCTEIEEKLNTMEDRTTAVEADVEALKEQLESHGGQLTDIM